MRNFVLPGGHPALSACHLARTVCRRAERRAVALDRLVGQPDGALQYLNRLSDAFFTLGRWVAHTTGDGRSQVAPGGQMTSFRAL